MTPDLIQKNYNTNKPKSSQKQKEKDAIMDELSIDETTYNAAALHAEKMLDAMRHTYITEKVNEIKVNQEAKQAEQERLDYEHKQMEIAEEHRASKSLKKEKILKLKYRLIMLVLFLYVVTSLVFVTTGFTDFITYKDLSTALYQMIMGIF